MGDTRVVFCSDVHLCQFGWYGPSGEERMEKMIDELNAFYTEKHYEKIVFLGDYSLDHWACQEGGSWVNSHTSNTERFVKEYASRLKVPYYMAPGNHEQYGYDKWREITGCERETCFTVGGYLLISCDNYDGVLDPDFHSDGTYTPTNIPYIKECLEKYPDMPVILFGHYFDLKKEPKGFFDFLKQEKRIVLLAAGHTHTLEVINLGERADGVCMYIEGHYSYTGGNQNPTDTRAGFSELILTDTGVDITYIEPASWLTIDGDTTHFDRRERHQGFFKRRDI